jgi:hypothetical protein
VINISKKILKNMTDNNKIYDLPKTETVSCFDENEWNKVLAPEEIEKSDELTELEYQDRLLNGLQYGPGNEQSKEVAKCVGKMVVSAGVGAAVISTGGIAGPLIGAGLYVNGAMISEGSKTAPSGTLRDIVEVVADGVKDGGLSGAIDGTMSQASNSLASHTTQAVGHRATYEIVSHGRKITNGAKVLMKTGKVISVGQRLYEIYEQEQKKHEDFEIAFKITCYSFHGRHRDNGTHYDSECPVCKGDI